MEIIFSTCNRQPAYLHQTLATMLISGIPQDTGISLVMDSYGDFLPHYHHKRISKYARPDEAAEGMNTVQRAGMNCFRCLAVAQDKDALLCEDDLVFAPNFYEQLQAAIRGIEELVDRPYLLSISNSYHDPETLEHFPGKNFVRVNQRIRKEDGLLVLSVPLWAIYLPKCFPYQGLQHFIYNYAVLKTPFGGGHDIAVSWYCHLANFPVFSTVPPLAQHVGVATNIQKSKDIKVLVVGGQNGPPTTSSANG